MQRGTRRNWIKIFITGWLHGSIRWQLTPEERSVWADLLCLAGECNQGGKICDNDNRALPRDFIADRLHIRLELLENTLQKCQDEGRVQVLENQIIFITNWTAYQSEYGRQKRYRARHQPDKVAHGEFQNVLLTVPEHQKLIERFGSELPEKIGRLSEYIESRGLENKYKSHYAVILRWARRDNEKSKGSLGEPQKYDLHAGLGGTRARIHNP